MDWQDEKIIYTSAKSQSDTDVPVNNICSTVHCECTESLNYCLVLERLKLENTIDLVDEKIPPISQLPDGQTCICTECFGQGNRAMEFRTCDISSLRLVIQGHQILNHQGTRHSPDDVAPYWKKDSRMWLWKSVRLSRTRKNKSKSLTQFPPPSHTSIGP